MKTVLTLFCLLFPLLSMSQQNNDQEALIDSLDEQATTAFYDHKNPSLAYALVQRIIAIDFM